MLDLANTYTMAKNYSHCPLKKRPIQFAVKDEDDVPMVLTPPKVENESLDEPENLSTKPEDLSRRAAFPIKAESPPVPISVPVPQRLGSTGGAFHRVAPISPEPLHYAPTTWHRVVAPSAPHYPPAYFPLGYPYSTAPVAELYHHPYPMYPSPPPPFAPRDSSCSPPQVPTLRTPIALLPMSPRGAASLSPGSSLRSSSPISEPADLSPPPSSVGHQSAQSLPAMLSAGAGGVRSSNARHQCPDCGKSYSTFSGMSKHRQFHCAAGDAPRRSFSCKYCEKVYVSLGALKMHIRTHTLPCKCTLCGKAFSRPWLLQGHIRTHTGEKPFSCQHCHRAFADRSNLRAHLQTHSDIKKYSCPTCSKTFSRMSLLTKHAEGGCTGGSVVSSHMYTTMAAPKQHIY